jgi:DNA-binding NtrC family response regulator
MSHDMERRIASLLIGESVVMRRLRQMILRLGPSRIPILVYGPTGAGKELVAQALHLASERRGGMAALNACAIGDTMFEDALFGHVRGAFTGATTDSPGYLREAQGGTLFLDEITGISLAAQAKLLRAIETGTYRPVGSSRDQCSDFRVIAATNEDPAAQVAAGRFRADLLHRLDGFVLTVPSLKERRDDIHLLVRHFASSLDTALRFTPEAIERLVQHDWPGNVRELRYVVERVGILAPSSTVTLAVTNEALAPHAPRPATDQEQFLARRLRVLLHDTTWNVDLAAERLGVHRTTLYRRLRRLGIDTRREKSDYLVDRRVARAGCSDA